MYIDASGLDPAGTYRLLVGSVVPRPIAWVTTGVPPKPVNLAPFSSFTWVSQHPAMLGFCVNLRPTGRKDTVRNIEEDGEFVVNIADDSLVDLLHASSEGFAPDISEAVVLGLDLEPSTQVRVPHLRDAPISMECTHHDTVRFSPTGGDFVVGVVRAWHVRDEIMQNGRIDTQRLRPLGRIAGPRYAGLGPVIEMPPVPGG